MSLMLTGKKIPEQKKRRMIKMTEQDAIIDILESLEDIRDDSTVPKNVRSKIDEMISTLKDEGAEISLRVDKVQQELEDISSDSNLQAFTRTQLWNVVSLLETLL